MKKGLAVISKMLLMVVILVVGFSSYTAYMYFADPVFDFYGVGKYLGLEGSGEVEETEVVEEDVDYASLLPDVHTYVDGANADMILVYRKNEQIIDMYGIAIDNQSSDFGVKSEHIVSAFGAVIGPGEENDNNGAFILAVELESEKHSTALQEMADSFLKLSDDIEWETEIIGNILVVRVYGSLFEGSVIDNPLINKIDVDNADSEVIVLIDPVGLPEVNDTIGTMLGLSLMSTNFEGGDKDSSDTSAFEKFVHSLSRMASFTSFEAFYLKSDEEKMEFWFVVDVLDKTEVDGARITEEEYVRLQTSFGEVVEGMNKEGYADIEDLNMSFEGNRFKAYVSIPVTKGLSPQVRARDAARISHLNQIVTALEMYSLDNGEYFEKSACVSDIQSLGSYFPRGELPVDPEGSVTFVNAGDGVDVTCSGGYFYQYFGDGEYVLWAKMEVDVGGNGNQKGFYTDKGELSEVDGGDYYIYKNADSEVPGKMYPYVGDLPLELMEDFDLGELESGDIEIIDLGVEDLEEETPVKTGVPRT